MIESVSVSIFDLFVYFIFALIIGYEIITKIPPTLHTPLMSGTNAISGIIIVGALVSIPSSSPAVASILGTIALALATINVIGGYVVTNRMLSMFGKKK